MERLPMCRICLVNNVRMCVLVNKNLQEVYEKLTGIPFVTEDRRPMLTCFFCRTKLKQCDQLLRKCLQAEELLTQIMYGDCEPHSVVKQDCLEFFNGLTKSLTENIDILEEGQTETVAIKEEIPDVYDTPDDIAKTKEETQNNELDNLDTSCLELEDIPSQYSGPQYSVPLMEFQIEAEEEQVSMKKPRAMDTKRAPVVEKPELEGTVTAEQKKKGMMKNTLNHMSKPDTIFREPVTNTKQPGVNDGIYNNAIDRNYCNKKDLRFETKLKIQTINSDDVNINTLSNKYDLKCEICKRGFRRRCDLNRHIRAHGGENNYKCEICQRGYRYKDRLTRHYLVHTSDKPHQCGVCQRYFKYKNTLASHARTHSGVKPFKCDTCRRSFGFSSDLKKHIRIHTGEKPYKCDVCQRCFNQSNNLIRHFLQHSGE